MALDSSLAVALQVTQHLTRKASYWGPLTETGTSVGGADRQEDWGFSFEHFRFAMSVGFGVQRSDRRRSLGLELHLSVRPRDWRSPED